MKYLSSEGLKIGENLLDFDPSDSSPLSPLFMYLGSEQRKGK